MADKFDDLNSLWGDGPPPGGPPDPPDDDFGDPEDDDDDGEDDDRRKKKKKKKPEVIEQRYGGISFLPMSALPAPDGRDRPPSDPLKWKTFRERFSFLPYATPKDEFLQNSHTLNLQTLLYRWAGMEIEGEPADKFIYRFWYDPATPIERAKAQAQRMRSMGLPDPKDRESMEIENAYQAALIIKRIRFLEFILDVGCMPTTEQLFRFSEGGTVVKEEMRPLSPAEIARFDNQLAKHIETYRMLTGQVTRTTKTELDSRVEMTVSVREYFTEALKGAGYVTDDGFVFSDLLAGNAKALPSANFDAGDLDAVEGEIVYNETPGKSDPRRRLPPPLQEIEEDEGEDIG